MPAGAPPQNALERLAQLHPAVRDALHGGPLDAIDLQAVDVPAVMADADGNPVVNEAKYSVKQGWFPADNGSGDLTKPLILPAALKAAGDATIFVQRPGLQGGDIELIAHMARSTGRFAVMPASQSLNLQLANKPIASNLIFGKAALAGVIPASHYEPGTGAVVYSCFNLTALANSVFINGVGRRFLTKEAQDTIEARRSAFMTSRINTFWGAPDQGPEIVLAPGASASITISLPSIGDFLALTWLDDSTTSDPLVRPELNVKITDGLSGYPLMPAPINWLDFVAAGQLWNAAGGVTNDVRAAGLDGPHLGLFTHLFARSCQIILDFTSLDLVNTITLRPGVRGIQIRYKQGPKRGTNTSNEVRQEQLRRSVPAPFRNLVQGG